MLTPFPTIQGPLPVIVPLLMDTLRRGGMEVFAEHWGRHKDEESYYDKLWGRVADIRRIRATLSHASPPVDVLYIASSHDWNTIVRDLTLLKISRGLYKRSILQIHGSSLDRIQGPGYKGFKTASKLLFRLCDGIIVSSSQERRCLAEFFPGGRFFVADNIYQSPVPPPAERGGPAAWGLPEDRPIIFFAARLIPEKGILDLLEAMPLVLAEAPCHLLVAGVGPLAEEVQRRLSGPPLSGRATWVRYLDRGLLELAYSLTDIFVLPTYHNEGFPAVIQDALGHGLPIITTPTRGLADHLVDGIHSLHVPPGNSPALAAALLKLIGDSGLRRRMEAANRKKAEDFSPQVVGQQYQNILQQVLGGKG